MTVRRFMLDTDSVGFVPGGEGGVAERLTAGLKTQNWFHDAG